MKQRFELSPEDRLVERAFLVGVSLPDTQPTTAGEHLEELQQLATTAGAVVVGRTVQGRTRIDGTTYVGAGKAEAIREDCAARRANLVVFDCDLSPAQARNLEKILGINVIDRTELILDIFARHAKTQQAKTQVELAQLIYLLPRLRKLWDHLSRQQGGIGTRGPGETQLEVDRRRVRERIGRLKKQLETFERRRDVLRNSRDGHPVVALVGYTNAGKSTLMNALTGADTLAENQLFATLDTLTRRMETRRHPVLLVDTVGFIRKLPHHLVESFKATLGDIANAELCLHVIDLSHHAWADQMDVADATLRSIRGDATNTLHVFNKIDAVEPEVCGALTERYDDAVFISAARHEGLDELVGRLEHELFGRDMAVEIKVRPDNGKAIAAVKRLLHEPQSRVEDGYCVINGRIKSRSMPDIERLRDIEVRYQF